mgnify:CR=1 FL=1
MGRDWEIMTDLVMEIHLMIKMLIDLGINLQMLKILI